MSYIVDTNIVMKDIDFTQYDKVYVPVIVLEELDKHNHSSDESKSYKSRNGLRNLRKSETDKGNIVYQCNFNAHIIDSVPSWLDLTVKDNIILLYAIYIQSIDKTAILLTEDLNMYQKAKSLNIKVELLNSKIEDTYKGYIEFKGTEEEFNSYYDNLNLSEWFTNEYLIFTNTENGKSKEMRFNGDEFVSLKLPPSNYIKAKTPLQRCALDLLNNDDITIVGVLGGYGCVDSETEYFNGEKWKKISEYDTSDMVMQYNLDTEEATLVYPLKYHKYECDKMYSIKTKYGVDQCLSEEHNVIYRSQKNFLRKEQLINILNRNDTTKFSGKFITTFNYCGKGIALSDPEIELMLAVICDGTFQNEGNRCRFHIKKDRKKEKLRDIFKRCDIEYVESKSAADGYTDFHVSVPKNEKIFGTDWYNCNHHQLELICENVMFWDGNVNYSKTNNVKRMRFSTSIKETADFVQFAFSACGYRANISIHDRTGNKYITCGKEYTRKSVEYNVIVSNNKLVGFGGRKPDFKEVSPVDGYKYCFTMPLGTLILRRNNCIFVTGNSGKTHLCTQMAMYNVVESYNSKQSKILGVREPRGEGKDIGYLKGTFEDKTGRFFKPVEQQLKGGELELEKLTTRGVLETTIPFYMKGTTYDSTIILVDEAEDLSESQIRLIGTRLGKDSKIYFSGDYAQSLINSSLNNPLVKMCNILKGNPKFGCIYLDEDVRSETSKIFANLFK